MLVVIDWEKPLTLNHRDSFFLGRRRRSWAVVPCECGWRENACVLSVPQAFAHNIQRIKMPDLAALTREHIPWTCRLASLSPQLRSRSKEDPRALKYKRTYIKILHYRQPQNTAESHLVTTFTYKGVTSRKQGLCA